MPQHSSVPEDRFLQLLDFELGPAVRSALEDPVVLEVLLNPDGSLWTVTAKEAKRLDETMAPERAESLLGTIASYYAKTISADDPGLEAVIPRLGFRITGLIPPVVSAPTFAIRKPPATVFALDQLVAADHARALRAAISERRTILVAGGTGSGKTTLANSLLREIALLTPEHRLISLEDTPELTMSCPNAVSFLTAPNVDFRWLLRKALRFHPHRIIVGEVRGSEALDLLKAWNTGHPGGIATVHANSAATALDRLDQLCQEGNVPSQRRLIATTIHVVVYLAPLCVVRELVRVERVAPDSDEVELLPLGDSDR
jgi:P-type conjugative transfer ATPase TrbB